MEKIRNFASTPLKYCALLCAMMMVVGCKKPTESAGGSQPEAEIAILGKDLNPDGTLGTGAFKTLDDEAKQGALSVNFVRAPLSDRGLLQLAKYPNVRHVAAAGSKITDAGIDQLKRALPNVEVVK